MFHSARPRRASTRSKGNSGSPLRSSGFFAGTALAYQQSLGTEPILIGTALLAVYIVLGILYENLVHPITIISTIFSASAGAMLALTLTGGTINVISIIGIVLLIGIVKKNAIMMIDFALQAERDEGKGSADAIFEACMLRFRPIMMTTMAALFGALPLALGTGTGSELRRPLGISIVGGLDCKPDADALYHAGALSRVRPHQAASEGTKAGCISPWRGASSRPCICSKSMTYFQPAIRVCLCAMLATLAGCLIGPRYQVPAPTAAGIEGVPAGYKENPANFKSGSGWKVAQPSDAMLRGQWWKIFRDPELDALEDSLEINNQNIKEYFQNFMEARGLVGEANSQLYPTLTANASYLRSFTGGSRGSGGGSSTSTASSAAGAAASGVMSGASPRPGWQPPRRRSPRS